MTTVYLYEDNGYRKLLPLTWNRPSYDLKCGMLSLAQKALREYAGHEVVLLARDYLAEVLAEEHPDVAVNAFPSNTGLFLNGRAIARGLSRDIPPEGDDCVFTSDGQVVAVRVSGDTFHALKQAFDDGVLTEVPSDLPMREVAATMIRYSWDLVHHNGEEIAADFELLFEPGLEGDVHPGALLVNDSRIAVRPGAEIRPGAVLDADEGPIAIDEGATVMSNAFVQGPCYVGPNSQVKVGAKIYEGTSLGEWCKVGGEVEESIFHSYSNKQHDGFLGHAYLGMWINIGADTNNSDLKNNYGSVKVHVDGETVDSGSLFVGLMMGDHSKTGINSMFNTGTVVGFACNVYGSGFPDKFVPSFSWGGAEGLVEFRIDKMLETAERMMARRKRELTPAQERLIRTVFELTAAEREAVLGC
jgi:UDP-N-acetylglucosamine diphosphorylase/glucosamine-1-phosphate N-acetyltransferase